MITIQNYIANLFTPELLEAIGWTIIHSLWQGALVAILLAIVLNTLKHNASTNRYVVSVTALFAMLQISLFTFFTVYEPHTDFSNLTAPSAIIGNTVGNEMPAFAPHASTYTQETSVFQDITNNIQFLKQNIANNLNYIVSIWIIGVALFTIRFLGGLLYVNRLKTQMVGLAPESWQTMANTISHKLRLRKSVKVLLSDLVSVPTAIGIFKPVILMPISLQTGLTVQEIESILAHELAHIRRNDYLINVFQSVAEILFFYHPATWWISGIIRDERENCCDDMAVSILGDSMAYSRTLARMNELTVKQTYTQTALAFNGKKGSLLGRIKRLFTHKNENNVLAERFAAVTIILAAMLVSLTANAGLVANKAVQLVREVNNQMPSMTSFESDNSGNWASENWDSSLSDTTKKRKKLFITIDENGKVDTLQVDNQGVFPPMPPMPPLPPMPPMPPDFPDMEDLEDIDIDVDFDDEKAMNHSTVQVLDGKNGKVVIVNGKKIDIDSISKNAKTVNVDNENGKVRIIIDGKVAKTIDVDKIRKDVRIHKVYRNSFAPFDQNSRQNSKSFDSLKNTKEYKKKREKYEKALKDYQELIKEYENKLPKDKSLPNTAEWRDYAEALRDKRESMQESREEVNEYEHAIREHERAIRDAERERKMAEHEQVRAQRDLERAEKERVKNEERLVKVKAELAKDGFKTDKFKIKINAETVEINDNKVSPELEKKYRSLFDWNENKKGTMTMEIN